jgi:hypothetical protein
MASTTPTIRELSREECESVLRVHKYGRLAFTFHDRVDIEPIHYIYDDGWIVARTGLGTKLNVMGHHPWVAFEVDDVQDMFSWRSVVVKGTAYMMEEGGTATDIAARDHAIAAFRRLLPAAFTPDDPLPSRNVLFRVHIDEFLGRVCAR